MDRLNSKNKQVNKFLDDLQSLDNDKFIILQKLRQIVLSAHPQVSERMMYGGIMFSLNADFGGIFAYKNHISFEFSQGVDLSDPDKFLAGDGKYRRHLKIKNHDDIKDKKVPFYVKQMS
ncbi:MAG: DUF1801 domain-containing protein [Gammaproteobacteria bacterium]|nr:MAG: DUF1801 domain-containing protein [Gammaproteobacteria bacterium]